MILSNKNFSKVIELTPLISIDLILKNTIGQVLLGRRLNKPAKDFWFVPGGRIFKNESMINAFRRIAFQELGCAFSINDAQLLNVYEHFYEDNYFDDKCSTHYIVLAYELDIGKVGGVNNLPIDIQHSHYKWFDVGQLLSDSKVHINTKNYFTLNGK